MFPIQASISLEKLFAAPIELQNYLIKGEFEKDGCIDRRCNDFSSTKKAFARNLSLNRVYFSVYNSSMEPRWTFSAVEYNKTSSFCAFFRAGNCNSD